MYVRNTCDKYNVNKLHTNFFPILRLAAIHFFPLFFQQHYFSTPRFLGTTERQTEREKKVLECAVSSSFVLQENQIQDYSKVNKNM